jgi:hypothetical protein
VVVGATTIEWFQAVGTVAAVAAAVGIAWWGFYRERRRRPLLSLDFDPDLRAPDFMAGMWSGNGKFESHWVRLRVENKSGRRSADDVEALVIGVEPASPNGPARTLDVVPLRWSSTQDSYGRAATRITIPPGLSRHVDLIAIDGVRRAADETVDERPVVAIQVEPTPSDDRHLLPGGKYRVHLAVAARDTDATYFELDLEVPGERFGSDEIRKHLRVSRPVPKGPRSVAAVRRVDHQG